MPTEAYFLFLSLSPHLPSLFLSPLLFLKERERENPMFEHNLIYFSFHISKENLYLPLEGHLPSVIGS